MVGLCPFLSWRPSEKSKKKKLPCRHELLHIPPAKTARDMMVGASPTREQVEQFLFPKEARMSDVKICGTSVLQRTMVWAWKMVEMMLWVPPPHCLQGWMGYWSK